MKRAVTLKNGYRLGPKLGKGSFGEVYIALDDRDREFAAKLEARRDGKRRRRGPSQLEYEFRVYEMLGGCSGVPNIHGFWNDGDYNVLIMDKLGKSVQDVMEDRGGKLETKVVLAIGARTLKHLEYIHGQGLIHRDLKPQNMMLSAEASNEIYIIDYGLSKRIIVDGVHVPYNERKGGLTGTPRYCSISSHMAIEQSRRDDLESLLYILIYLKNGSLPWQGTKGTKQERYKLILKQKRRVSDAKLAEGWPEPFLHFVTAVRSLRFSEKPDYEALQKYLIDAHDSL
jgi:serine/threonine protein kinase